MVSIHPVGWNAYFHTVQLWLWFCLLHSVFQGLFSFYTGLFKCSVLYFFFTLIKYQLFSRDYQFLFKCTCNRLILIYFPHCLKRFSFLYLISTFTSVRICPINSMGPSHCLYSLAFESFNLIRFVSKTYTSSFDLILHGKTDKISAS